MQVQMQQELERKHAFSGQIVERDTPPEAPAADMAATVSSGRVEPVLQVSETSTPISKVVERVPVHPAAAAEMPAAAAGAAAPAKRVSKFKQQRMSAEGR